jgi:hypothetical protein
MKAQRGAGFGIVSYVVMAIIIVVILISGLVLVSVATESSSSDAGDAASPGAASSSITECSAAEWFDASSGSCVQRTVCEAGQSYDEGTNTCAVPLPTVKAIAPTSGLSTGGTEVRVTGSGFEPGASLLIDGIPAANVTVLNDTTITATTAGSANLYPVDVEVVNPGSEPVLLDNAFVYVAPPVERITELNPRTGSTAGGEAVIIKGVDFAEGIVVSFFGRPAAEVEVIDSSTLRVITPAGASGRVNVNVRNPGEAPYTYENGFRYVDRPPRLVTGVRPARGAASGGTEVTIIGSGFANGAAVTFGRNPARRVTIESSTRISAVTPPGRLGEVRVGVQNPGLPVALLEDAFTYVAAPTIASVRPARGPIDGGTKVTITGTGFGPDAVVRVGSVTVDDARVVSETTITFVMPEVEEPGKVNVSVTNPGEPRALARGAFTYRPTAAEPEPEPSATPTPTPTPTTPALPRCRTFSAGTLTGEAGTDLVLDQGTLFPAFTGVSGARLRDAEFLPYFGRADGSIVWQPSPPVIFWQTPADAGRGGTITYFYTASSCSGEGRGSIVVTSR